MSTDKFSKKSDLEKVYSLAKIATKMQFIIYIVFGIVAVVSSALSIVGLQADGCKTRYPTKKTNKYIKIPESSSKILRADGNYSKYEKNYPGNSNCKDCFGWMDSEIKIDRNISNLKQIYLSASGKSSLCASYVIENNIHKDGKKYLDNSGNKIRIPKLNEDDYGLTMNILARNDSWGNLLFFKPTDDLRISLVSSKIVKRYDVINDKTIFADCSSEEKIADTPESCGKYSYKVSIGCKCSNSELVEGCINDRYFFFPRKAFNNGAERVINYNNESFYVTTKRNKEYLLEMSPNNSIKKHEIEYAGTIFHSKSNFFDAYNDSKYSRTDRCYEIGNKSTTWDSDHDDRELYHFKRKIWQDGGENTYSKAAELDYFNYLNSDKNQKKQYVDDLIYNSQCYMKNLPCDYKDGDFTQSDLIALSQEINLEKTYIPYDTPIKTNIKKLWFSNGAGIIFRFTDSAKEIDSDQNYGSYGFFSKPLSNGEININYEKILNSDKYYYKPDISNGKYLQLKLYKPKNIDKNLATGGYLLDIKHSPCIAKNGLPIIDNNKQKVGYIEYIISSERPSINDSGTDISNSIVGSDDSSSIYKLQINESHIGKKLWIRMKADRSKPGDIDGSYKIEFLQNSEIIEYDNYSIQISNNILDATKKFDEIGINQFEKLIKDTNILFYIKIMLTIYVMFLGAGVVSGNISISSYELFSRLVKIIIVGGLMDKTTFIFFRDYLYPIIRGFPQAILASTISGDPNIGIASGSSDVFLLILNYFCAVFAETFLSASFFYKMMSVMVSGFGALLILSIAFSVVLISLAVCKYIVVFMTSVVFNGLLLGLAPIFLSFILFEKTKYLFDNWLKYIVTYIVEPIIAGLGLIVFVNLFLIYLDSVFDYSVCFKCYIPLYIPIASLEIDLLCMSWFVPWGKEISDVEFLKSFSKSLSDSIALLIISSSAYKYHAVAVGMSSKISGVVDSIAKNFSGSVIAGSAKYFDSKMKDMPIYKQGRSFAINSGKNVVKGVSMLVRDPKDAINKFTKGLEESKKDMEFNNVSAKVKKYGKDLAEKTLDNANKRANIFSNKFWKHNVKSFIKHLKSNSKDE